MAWPGTTRATPVETAVATNNILMLITVRPSWARPQAILNLVVANQRRLPGEKYFVTQIIRVQTLLGPHGIAAIRALINCCDINGCRNTALCQAYNNMACSNMARSSHNTARHNTNDIWRSDDDACSNASRHDDGNTKPISSNASCG
jgi:hypothetical protein